MIVLFWCCLGIILYTYAGYPLFIALLAHQWLKPWTRAPWSLDAHPAPVSIVMAVHNGAAMLPSKLQQLLSLNSELIREIIVVSDGSTDHSSSILMDISDVRVKKVILQDQVGKAAAVNHGILAASGEILLFTDIRPQFTTDTVMTLLKNFADPKVGCVAGELLLGIINHDPTAAAVSGLYWRYEQWIRNCEAAFDSPVGVYGGFYAVRRELAVQAPNGLILDDMFQPLSIIRQGYRSVLDRSAIVLDRWPAKASGEFSRKVRTLAGNFQLAALAPWIISPKNRVLFQLISHKLLRLIVPYIFVFLIATSVLLGAHYKLYLVFAIAQMFFWLLAAVSIWHRIPLLSRIGAPASALLVLNAAAVMGLYKFLFTRGPLWKIWSPTAMVSNLD